VSSPLWLQKQHFDLKDPWEHVDFQVVAAYDVVCAAGWRIAMPVQPTAELWLVREGTVEIRLGDKTSIARAGSVALLFSGMERDTREIAGQRLSILGFSFRASLLGALDFVTLLELPLAFEMDTGRLGDLVMQMVAESQGRQPGYSLAVHGLGQLAFVELLRAQAASAPEIAARTKARLRAAQSPELSGALTYVAAHFDEPLDIPALAEAAHLSPKHFGRKFRAALGMTPMEFVRRYRLNQARDLLGASDVGAGTIASRCGFDDAAHFSRVFKREFGLSPLQYRQQMRELARNLESRNAPSESKNGG
jgi:AraC-like DNA-binding protein